MSGENAFFDILAGMDWSPLIVSLKISLCATVFAFVTGTAAAGLVFRCRAKARMFWDVLFTLPLVLPPTVVGFLLLLLLGRNGPVGKLLAAFSMRIIFTWEAAVAAGAVVAFPLVYRTMRAAFEQLDPAVLAAGRTLGLPERVIFFRLMLPMAIPGCVAAAVLGFARALGEFGATLMIAGNIPGETRTIPIAIWSAAESDRMTVAGIWVGIIIVTSLLVILPLNRWGDRRHA